MLGSNLFTWACFVVFALLGSAGVGAEQSEAFLNGTVPPNVTTAPPPVTSGATMLGFF
jgi:hypothetical protein